MTEILLFAVVVVLLAFIVWIEGMHMKDRRHLTAMCLAQRPQDVRIIANEPEPPRPGRPSPTPDDEAFWMDTAPLGL